jgi:hypothetical protein
LQSREVLKMAANESRREALDPAQPCGLPPYESHRRADHEFGVFDRSGVFLAFSGTSL